MLLRIDSIVGVFLKSFKTLHGLRNGYVRSSLTRTRPWLPASINHPIRHNPLVPQQYMHTRDERGFDGGCAPLVLPDVNGLLSIVFIGPSKFKAAMNNGNAGHGVGGWRIGQFERFWKWLEASCPFAPSP